VIAIEQPKDTIAEGINIAFPDGASVKIDKYQSTANAAAIAGVQAQAETNRKTVEAGYSCGERMFELGAKAATKSPIP